MTGSNSLYNATMPLPEGCSSIDFTQLGLDPAEITSMEVLRRKDSHLVCRLKVRRSWRVLKWFEADPSLEPQLYALFDRWGVPTLPVYSLTNQALLLDDLAYSRHWRMADPDDMRCEATGLALAAWYRRLHEAGIEILSRMDALPRGLTSWVEELSPEILIQAGRKLGLDNQHGWQVALEKLDMLKTRTRLMRQTINYNDFAQENLALSRGKASSLRAVVFDYDWVRIGMVYSDLRNVTYSLVGDARHAFLEAYGPVNDVERLLDIPLSILYGLMIAAGRENMPGWALPLLEDVRSGRLQSAIRDAVE